MEKVEPIYDEKDISDQRQKIYQESINFVVVRNPLERIVSAYLDKVEQKTPTMSPLAKFSWKVAKKYGNRWKSDIRSI